MGTSEVSRPAHRPSRRDEIIDVATRLFARIGFDEVTVGDIANACSMTPAAVYYHFAGKEQILLEAVRLFADRVLDRARTLAGAGVAPDTIVDNLGLLVAEHHDAATVYFLSSAGLNLSVEAQRRVTRAELGECLAISTAALHPDLPPAEAAVIGVALVSIVETAAGSALGHESTASTVRSAWHAAVALARATVAPDSSLPTSPATSPIAPTTRPA